MAIVNLGTINPVVGDGLVLFDTFPFTQDRAYAIGLNISTDDEDAIYSFLRFRMQIEVSGQPSFIDTEFTDIDIFNSLFVVKFACSPLYRGDGDLVPTIERIPFSPKAGDVYPITISAFYDDASFVPSWRA